MKETTTPIEEEKNAKIYSNIHTGVRLYRPCVCPFIRQTTHSHHGPIVAAMSCWFFNRFHIHFQRARCTCACEREFVCVFAFVFGALRCTSYMETVHFHYRKLSIHIFYFTIIFFFFISPNKRMSEYIKNKTCPNRKYLHVFCYIWISWYLLLRCRCWNIKILNCFSLSFRSLSFSMRSKCNLKCHQFILRPTLNYHCVSRPIQHDGNSTITTKHTSNTKKKLNLCKLFDDKKKPWTTALIEK